MESYSHPLQAIPPIQLHRSAQVILQLREAYKALAAHYKQVGLPLPRRRAAACTAGAQHPQLRPDHGSGEGGGSGAWRSACQEPRAAKKGVVETSPDGEPKRSEEIERDGLA